MDSLRMSSRYGTLAESALARAARWAIRRARSEKEAARLARRKLHQVHGAFVSGGHLEKASAIVERGGDVVEVCRAVLDCQTSTMQRMAYAEEFYGAVRSAASDAASVVDLACGLHPFAIPFMGLGGACRYDAYEVDSRFVRLVERLDARLPQHVRAFAADLVDQPVECEADVIFLLNTVPTLEQQEKGASKAVLAAARSPVTIVSFPARSLCGRTPMKRVDSARTLEAVLPADAAIADTWEFSHETVFVVRRR